VREQTSVVRIKAGSIAYDLGDLTASEKLLRDALASLSTLASGGHEHAALWAAEAAAELSNLLSATGRTEESRRALLTRAINSLEAVPPFERTHGGD